jgi:flagellar biosynthesis/type III secretory pathway protein FliH
MGSRIMMQTTAETHEQGFYGQIEVLQYPECPGAPPVPAWDGWEEVSISGAAVPKANTSKPAEDFPATADPADWSLRLAEQTRKAFAEGHEQGLEEGRQMERQVQASGQSDEEARHKQQLAGLIVSFTAERDRFLQSVESEVVRLALAIASRILRREAQMDPLLLTGAVRVALGQLAKTCEARLRVPARELDLWTETIALLPNLPMRPAVEAGEGLRLGDCIIESKVGTVDLGIRSQLDEIERGFFDRDGSPVAAPAATIHPQDAPSMVQS